MNGTSDEKFSNIPVLWKPRWNSGKRTRRLMKQIENKYQTKFYDYWDFYQWSVDHVPEFWAEMWEFTGVIYSKQYHQVIDMNIPMSESPKWFDGAEMNFAENLLKFRDNHVALVLAGEDRETVEVTYAQLYEEAELYASAFRKFGIRKGDTVMCYMSNRKEAILGMLATASLGAIWTGTLPQMGHEPVLNRMSQVNPKLLLTIDRFSFNYEEIDMLSKVEKIVKGLPSLEKVIIVPSKEKSKHKNVSNIRNSCFLNEFLDLGRKNDGSIPTMRFEQVPVSYPVFIHFTSGTTGLPKAIVHGSGILLTNTKAYAFHIDGTREDVFLSGSPVGWATWTIFTCLLFSGFKMVLYEGNPFPIAPAFWDLIDKFYISHLFLVPSFIYELEKRRYLPTKKHHLGSLKVIMLTGGITKLRSFDFIYDELKLNVLFASLYGFTEIVGFCATVDVTLPLYKGETSTPSLGTVIQCYDETGEAVIGKVGELVITTHTPDMALGLIGDVDGSKYREKYFSKYPGKFLIGDNGIINPITNGLVFCGRSDCVLNQRGFRIGSSDIYNVVEHFHEVLDSLCVSQYSKDLSERSVLFLKIRDDYDFDEQLVNRIRERIAKDLLTEFVPDVILETGGIPYSTNGKKMEIIVKSIINNIPCDSDSVHNPECLRYYQSRPELQGF